MKQTVIPNLLCRALALMLTLVLFIPAPAWSQSAQQLISITIHWNDGESDKAASAVPIPYAGFENSFWLFLPAGALDNNPLLTVEDIQGGYASFSIPAGSPLPPYEDADGSLNGIPIDIVAYNQNGQEQAHFYLYLSATAEQPAPPEVTAAPVNPVEVTVYYRTTDGLDVASSQKVMCAEGKTQIPAQPYDLKSGYVLLGEGAQTVTVDANGADRTEIVFLYGMPVVEPMDITVYYRGEDGNDIAAPQTVTCTEGTNTITAHPGNLPNGFALLGENVQYVILSAEGANPNEIVFTYHYTEPVTEPPMTAVPTDTPKPAPVTVFVPVYYRDMDGNTLWSGNVACVEGEPNPITAEPANLTAGYTLSGDGIQYVAVDASGTAVPAEVVFLFTAPEIAPVTAVITIRYLNENQEDIANQQTFTCVIGNNIITPRPDNLPAGYTLISDPMPSVTLSQSGALSSTEVLFTYAKDAVLPTAEPATAVPDMTQTPAPQYAVIPMDAYCFPLKDGVNFRSTPSTHENNILYAVGKSSLGHITGRLTNGSGELWYAVTIGSDSGYLIETVIQVLTPEEYDALMNPTPVPTGTPKPVATETPTEIPDGAAIDLWSKVSSASVKFRSAPAKVNGNVLTTLSKGHMVWIYTSMTVDGAKWYVARDNGKDGYIMAEFISLDTQEESDLYQSQLPSPMPLQTPAYSQMPTAAPTAVVTATPVPVFTNTPGPTNSPLPYEGYALTTVNAALLTGISISDESVLATLPPQSLVYLWSQVYVEGVTWNYADAMGLGISGYLPDSVLRRITAAEAEYYRQLQMPTSTPEPVATQVPASYGGYAKTLGNNVPMRSFADTNAMIVNILPDDTVVQVIGQEYMNGIAWHVVLYASQWGYIREDQLAMLNEREVAGYLSSLETPLPSPAASSTPAPITGNSPSSYGYVSTDKVRLRSGAGTDTAQIKMLSKYAFALVLGAQTGTDGKLWYKVSQAGTEGYILSDYFKVLPLGGLTAFLQSADYLSAGDDTSSNGASGSNNITSIEDFNTGVWTNPNLANASYEPFNPFASATPSVETIATSTPAPTATQQPLNTFIPAVITADKPTTGLSFLTKLFIGILAAAGGGGGLYAYMLHRSNQRRAEERASQRRNTQTTARPAQPYDRPTAAGTQPGAPYAAPFLPPQGGAPRPPQQQSPAPAGSTRVYPAVNPYAPPQTQAAKPYIPGQTPVKPYTSTTQPYAPGQAYTPPTPQYPPQKPAETQAPPVAPAGSPDRAPTSGEPTRHRRSDKHNS
jgi:hypothetical protein